MLTTYLYENTPMLAVSHVCWIAHGIKVLDRDYKMFQVFVTIVKKTTQHLCFLVYSFEIRHRYGYQNSS